MLLIIFLGLIAKLASVSDGCDVGTSEVNNFDFYRFSGLQPWYYFWHSTNDTEDNFVCVSIVYGIPTGNISQSTTTAFDTSTQVYLAVDFITTNWDGTGFEEVTPPPSIWSGRYYVIAIDYEYYFIMKHCAFNSTEPIVYVGYRSQNPDNATQQLVQTKLQENNIDASQLVLYWTDQCK